MAKQSNKAKPGIKPGDKPKSNNTAKKKPTARSSANSKSNNTVKSSGTASTRANTGKTANSTQKRSNTPSSNTRRSASTSPKPPRQPQNLNSKTISKDKESIIHKLLVVLGLVSDKKKKKEEKYNSYNIGQVRRVRNKETAGHFAYTITKSGTGENADFGYVSITTDGNRKNIEKLVKNPNPNDSRDSYVVNQAKHEKAKRFGKMQKDWHLTKKDKKHIKEIYKKNSRNNPTK